MFIKSISHDYDLYYWLCMRYLELSVDQNTSFEIGLYMCMFDEKNRRLQEMHLEETFFVEAMYYVYTNSKDMLQNIITTDNQRIALERFKCQLFSSLVKLESNNIENIENCDGINEAIKQYYDNIYT